MWNASSERASSSSAESSPSKIIIFNIISKFKYIVKKLDTFFILRIKMWNASSEPNVERVL